MQNNGLIKFFAFCFGLVSLYQISFTFISSGVERQRPWNTLLIPFLKTQANFSDKRQQKYVSYLDSIADQKILGFTTHTKMQNRKS